MADPMEVRLERHEPLCESPIGPVPVFMNQYFVFVHSAALRSRNPAEKLHVGIIGSQAGANFCPTNEFYSFQEPQREFIASEAKRLHGSASPAPHVEVPPPLAEPTTDWDAEHEDGDTDDE